MNRRVRDLSKRVMFGAHKVAARLGVHVVPVHYYSPIPDVNELAATRHLWARRSELPGMHVDLDEQSAALREICLPYREEYRDNHTYVDATTHGFGPGYGAVEAQVLHGVMRHFKPRRVVEVGSGVSTACMVAADAINRRETGAGAEITCIEPYPSEPLRTLPVRLLDEKVQQAPMETFTALERGDLLFIDSSHVIRPGGDVNFLYLEVLPRLKPGVVIHIHDIVLPYDYGPDTLKTFLHWNETVLVRAMLTHTTRYRIVASLSLLYHDRPEVLKELFPNFVRMRQRDGLWEDSVPPFGYPKEHFPSSLYLQTA